MAALDNISPVRDPGPATKGSALPEALPQPSQCDFPNIPMMTNRSKAMITFCIVSLNTIQFTSNFITFAGGLSISADLGRTVGSDQANWMPASYPMTQSAFVLITGRLGDVYGHKQLALLGCLVFGIFSLVNAFCTSYEAFIAARALTGVGGGIFMPNAVSMITIMIPPGRSRNLFLGFFAASHPLGGVIGALLTGAFINTVGWKWLFILITITTAILSIWLCASSPQEIPVDKKGTIDFLGAFTGLGSLLLFNIVCNQAPSAGWSAPSVIGCLSASMALFTCFITWQAKFAREPIMPLSIFKAPSFSALICVVLFSYMGFGITLWYSVSWQQILRNTSVLGTGINFIPFGVASLIAVFVAAWLVSRIPAQWIMAIGVVVVFAASIILATMPKQQTYWAQAFPAMVLSGFCPDLVFVAAQVIASNSVHRHQQGVASSLIGTLNLYGTSLGLGFAAIIETEVAKASAEDTFGFRAALYFAAGISFLGLLLDICFVRLPKEDRNGWSSEGGI